jgi:hypothetical protein
VASLRWTCFVVRTLSFKLLYGLVILRHTRRRLVTIAVTTNPTAQWLAGQVTEAFPEDEAPKHLRGDRDGAFGPGYTHRIRTMGIRDHPTAPRSPWQNGYVKRLIGAIRREALDHLIVFDEAQLRRVLKNSPLIITRFDASLIEEECARISTPAEARPHRQHPNPRRPALPIRPGLGCD